MKKAFNKKSKEYVDLYFNDLYALKIILEMNKCLNIIHKKGKNLINKQK